jgi:protein-tyrosine phosphatase
MSRALDDWPDEWGVPDFDGAAHSRPLTHSLGIQKPFFPTCSHWREPVDIGEDVVVFASAWFDRPSRRRVDMDWPDVGFYLDGSWASGALVSSPGFRPPFTVRGKAQIVLYPWPDLGVPQDPRRFKRAIRWVLEQATAGRRVEVGCAGGHGRTGTTIAVLLVLQGMSPREAIRRVRRSYCDEAIESREQAAMIRRFAG